MLRASTLSLRLRPIFSQCHPVLCRQSSSSLVQTSHTTSPSDTPTPNVKEDSRIDDVHSREKHPVGRPWRAPLTKIILPKKYRRKVTQPLSSTRKRKASNADAVASGESHNEPASSIETTASSENVEVLQSSDVPSSQSSPKRYRRDLLRILGETQCPVEAWCTYRALLAIPRHSIGLKKKRIPFIYLHRLSRLLARTRPKTRLLFLRLFSVLKTIQQAGGKIHLDEWNALISSAGGGWRKTGPEDFKLPLDIFNDMILGKELGGTSSGEERVRNAKRKGVKPDIVTYTTLLAIAARASSVSTIQHATSMLKASGIPPNRITHLTLLRHFTRTKSMSGFQSTLTKMREQGLELGLDGINACIWFFGRSDRVELASKVYRVLRHNAALDPAETGTDLDQTITYLANIHNIVIPDEILPNAVTYIMMIQILAYHGHFCPCLDVFIDMLSAKNTEKMAPLFRDEKGTLQPKNYQSTFPAFRALFLGFFRHAVPPTANLSVRLRALREQTTWTLENLEKLFESFLALPENDEPCRSTLFWIVVAFQKTSGDDLTKLREVWRRLEGRYPWPWADPGHRLSRLRSRLFPSGHVI